MLRTVSLPAGITRGGLYLCAMPGRREPLDVFFEAIAAAGIGRILCLVSDREIGEKSPEYLAAIEQKRLPVELLRCDVPDYGLPEDSEDLERALDCIQKHLSHGESVVIHCAAGHGRTGMVAILLLTRMGLPLEVATEVIRRAGSAPDTQEQLDYLRRHAYPQRPPLRHQ